MAFRTERPEPYWCWQRVLGAGSFLSVVLLLVLYKLWLW